MDLPKSSLTFASTAGWAREAPRVGMARHLRLVDRTIKTCNHFNPQREDSHVSAQLLVRRRLEPPFSRGWLGSADDPGRSDRVLSQRRWRHRRSRGPLLSSPRAVVARP